MTPHGTGGDAPLRITTPAHRFRQGRRDVYAFALDIATLDEALPDRVDDRVIKDANRPLAPAHAKKIQEYLEERPDWLLGTMMLGITPEAIEFLPYQEDDGGGPLALGELRVRADHRDAMKMFDGQHRRRAIKDALRLLKSINRGDKVRSLKEASIPIMLYAEDSIDALRQMFADASRTKTIERNTVTQFDRRDAFNLAALWLEEHSDLLSGRVEMERASVPRTGENIIAINQLSATLKTLEVGHKGRISKDLNSQYMLDLEDLCERCYAWADDFMPTAREEYEGLMAGEIDNSEIPQRRAETLAYNATVVRLFAACYQEWTKDGADWRQLAQFLRNASLKPGSGEGALLVDAGIVAPGGITPIVNVSIVTTAIAYIIRQARESTG